MVITITLIISSLVIINLLLLKFSCNKAIKVNKSNKKPIVLKADFVKTSKKEHLAPTGS